MFRYFNIRNFEIPEYRSFYIWTFKILSPPPPSYVSIVTAAHVQKYR